MANVAPGSFSPFEVSAVHIIYVGLGLFIVLFGMFSLFIKERLYLGEAPIAAVFGIIIGPAALNLFNPTSWGNNRIGPPGGHITDEITLEVMRVTIALSVFAVGVELPKKYLLRHWRSIALLLGPVMVWGWLITAAFMYALVPGLDFLNCLVVASCVTPTDPILAQAVVGGSWAEKHVPAHLRHMLMCESGCNDGAAFPFLYLALFLTINRDNHGRAIAEWFYDAWAYQIIFGTILGALIGWAARKLMRFSERHRLVDRESFVAQYVSLAIASMGVNVLLGSDDLLAAFACGTAFAWDGWFTKQTEDSNFSSIVDLLFNVATFIYIGALMPFADWAGGSAEEPNTLSIWRLFVLAICVLLTKRLPIVIILWRWIPDIKTFREAVFAGHFGPIGVGAIFIATLARTLLPEEVPSPPQTSNDILALTVQPIIFFFVLCSIVLHGLTIPFFAFSKRATTLTRTWSRNPSFMVGDNEPSWVSRFRKNKTGENLSPEEGNMTEIERALNAQLGIIGRGAIGGDAEKELRRSDTSPSGGDDDEKYDGRTARGDESDEFRLYNRRTQEEMQDLTHDFDEDHVLEKEDPTDDWGGENTIEMKRYRQMMQEKKEIEYAHLRQKQQQTDEEDRQSSEEKQRDGMEGDLGMASGRHSDDDDDDEEDARAPMDRDINQGRINSEDEDEAVRLDKEGQAKWGCGTSEKESTNKEEKEHDAMTKKREKEECYPRSKTWVEGSKLVIEHQKSKSSEAEVTVIPLMDHEKDVISSASDPAHAWVQTHAQNIEAHLGLENVADWHPKEAANHLMHHRIPHLYNEYLDRRGKRRNSVTESKEERDRRSQVLFESMNWASEQRRESPDRMNITSHPRKDIYANAESAREKRRKVKPRRPKSPEEEEKPISGWLASPGGSIKPKKNRRGTTSSPTNSPSRANLLSGSSGGGGQCKQYVCRPSASDSRRVELRKKLITGQLTLSKGNSRKSESSSSDAAEYDVEEVADTPQSRSFLSPPSPSIFSNSSSKKISRSSSAGGLNDTTSSTTSMNNRQAFDRIMHNANSISSSTSSSSSFLQIPRSKTIEPTTQDRESGASRRRGHMKSNSVQWLDINDSSHDRMSLHSFSQQHPSELPTRERVDTARIGGGITPRSGSRNPSPTRQMTDRSIISRSNNNEEEGDDDDTLHHRHSSHHNHHHHHSGTGSRTRHRIASLFTSLTAPSSSSSSSHHHQASSSSIQKADIGPPSLRITSTDDDDGDDYDHSPGHSTLNPHSIVHRSQGGGGGGNGGGGSDGGILAPPPSRTGTSNNDAAPPSSSAGVTFNL